MTNVKGKDLQYVLDWIAVQELVAEYGQAIDYGRDTGDWSRWVKVFTPEVTADYSRLLRRAEERRGLADPPRDGAGARQGQAARLSAHQPVLTSSATPGFLQPGFMQSSTATRDFGSWSPSAWGERWSSSVGCSQLTPSFSCRGSS